MSKKLLAEIMSSYVGAQKLPIQVSEPPLRPTNRWEIMDSKVLTKTFDFLSLDERNAFLYTLLQQDGQHGSRHARTIVDGLRVTVELGTKGGVIIDLDKNRAKMMDALWRDVVYSIGGRKF